MSFSIQILAENIDKMTARIRELQQENDQLKADLATIRIEVSKYKEKKQPPEGASQIETDKTPAKDPAHENDIKQKIDLLLSDISDCIDQLSAFENSQNE